MKTYIAYGETGSNKRFKTQGEIIAYFELGNQQRLLNYIEMGRPVEDPDTQERYYLDELEGSLAEFTTATERQPEPEYREERQPEFKSKLAPAERRWREMEYD